MEKIRKKRKSGAGDVVGWLVIALLVMGLLSGVTRHFSREAVAKKAGFSSFEEFDAEARRLGRKIAEKRARERGQF